MRLQRFAESGKGVTVPGGGSVLRNFQNARDLSESQLVPDFQNDDLPLFVRQTFHRCSQDLLAFVQIGKLRLAMGSAVARHCGFASRAPLIASQTVKSGRPDRGVEKSAIFDGMLAAPKPNKRLLHDILGFDARVRPASGEKK
jgi:hypothetical protein